jgi:hypothetical protein
LESKISRGSSGAQFASTSTAPTGTPEASEDDLCLEICVCKFWGRLDNYIYHFRPDQDLKRYYEMIAKHHHFTRFPQNSLRVPVPPDANICSGVLPLKGGLGFRVFMVGKLLMPRQPYSPYFVRH